MAVRKCPRQTTQIIAFEGSPLPAEQVFDMDNTPIVSQSGAFNVGFARSCVGTSIGQRLPSLRHQGHCAHDMIPFCGFVMHIWYC